MTLLMLAKPNVEQHMNVFFKNINFRKTEKKCTFQPGSAVGRQIANVTINSTTSEVNKKNKQRERENFQS